mmetsp:Transcript_9341/g.17928  ORF Transcript_9341/g.17928 Transcript_9341/m.17928 type:complete len:552 (-) Transcript_9341:4331-5986(-)
MGDELIPAEYLIDPAAFESVFCQKNDYIRLRTMASDGGIARLRNRFICWRIFLGIFPEDAGVDVWVETAREYRAEYSRICQSFAKVPTAELDPKIFNPLSAVAGNPWNEYYADNDLKNEIRRDVDRTHQERELFCRDSVKELLTNVLFAWAKLHPHLSYKQGMNELLAIIVFVGYAETETFSASNISDKAAHMLRILNSRSHLEADCFWLFSKLMDRGVKELFNSVLNRPVPKQKGKSLFEWDDEEKNDLVGQDKSDEQNASSVLKRCHRIHHRYLQAIDRELYDHLENQEVEPQMHLLRWIRCLLSREFHLADVLLIWDSIFSKVGVAVENRNVKMTGHIDFNKDLVLLDFLCVSMIIFVRSYLLSCDSTGILKRLLKYPPVEDIVCIINMAENYQAYIIGGCTSSKPSVLASRNSRTISTPVERTELPRSASPTRLNPVDIKPKPKINDNPLITPSTAGIRISGSIAKGPNSTSTPSLPVSVQSSQSTPSSQKKPPISPLQTLLELLTQMQSSGRVDQEKMNQAIEIVAKLQSEKMTSTKVSNPLGRPF